MLRGRGAAVGRGWEREEEVVRGERGEEEKKKRWRRKEGRRNVGEKSERELPHAT